MTSTTATYRGRHFASGEWVDLLVQKGRLIGLQPAGREEPAEQADWLAPAFFDLQINGGGGIGFTSSALDVDRIRLAVQLNQSHGVAAFVPTVVTHDRNVMQHAFQQLSRARETDAELARAMPLFHMEGPFISSLDGPRGAHPAAHVRLPDETEFQILQEAAGGGIGLVTVAPEVPGALPFIERRTKEGIVAAIGHSAAEPTIIRDAIQAGAQLSTHLGNGCPKVLPRHPNLLWEQLAADELMASLITDGHHLPWSLVRCFIRMKTPERIIITCDVSEMGGLPPGRYGQWDQAIEVLPEGKIVLSHQGILAGSWSFTDACVSRLVASGIVRLEQAIRMACHQPRQLLKQPVPNWASGEAADFLMLKDAPNGGFELQATYVAGRRQEPPQNAAWAD